MINSARQIWISEENGVNTWMCFRKEFDYYPEEGETGVLAQIAVDSKYWLYLNGELVIREGGLKRGPSRKGTYYEEVDLGKHLVVGKNILAILVWHFGKNGFSHLSSNLGGLRCVIDLPGGVLSTDGSWKVKKHPAFVEPDPKDEPTNFRLAEANIYFDKALDIEGWYGVDYDSSAWQYADEIPMELAQEAWGRLEKRSTPQLKDFGVKQYLNFREFKEVTLEEDTIVGLRLPYNAQFTPTLDITAPQGLKIEIRTDNFESGITGEKCAMSVYYTKEGAQSYEAIGWLNGEWAYYHIPAGVTIHFLGYRETGYNTEVVGSFQCDDVFLNKLWEKSLRTLYVTMRDTFMDCPDRERVQWWGDVNIEMQMALYCLDEKALLLYKKGVDSLVGWSEEGGHMMTVVPSGTEQFELPFQNLAGIWGFWYYYEYTGDKSVPEKAYQMSKEYLQLYSMGEDGVVVHRSGSWDWPDWGDHADVAVMENAWYYMALQSAKKMAELLDKAEDISFYEERLGSIKDNFDRMYWKDNCYYDSTDNGLADDRANALAVLSGLAKREYYPGILAVLESTENSSPYMEKYVLDAMCEMGYIEAAIRRMKRRYREMVEEDYSTLWEYWNKDGTKNHAWSGGPLITMAKYIAGIRPGAVGYEKVLIKPHLGHLKYVKCRVPSVRGEIVVEI